MNKWTVWRNSLLTLVALGFVTFTVQAASGTRPQPVPPLPTSTPMLSMEAREALLYVAHREGLAVENLVVVNEFHRESALLGQTFRAVTVLDMESDHFFEVLVDLNSGEVADRAVVEVAEEQLYRARYGRLQPAFYERLQTMRDDDTVMVTIWVAARPGRRLDEQQTATFAALASRYSQARVAMEHGSIPLDVDDPALAERLYDEYVQMLNDEIAVRIQPLVKMLEAGIRRQNLAGIADGDRNVAKESHPDAC